ncbi:MAG: hypothetical protein HY898_25395 [Deltaproteobacteria bacterium]|nr:hypothetical protein [Deltaproteobacteria bacterium]
MNIEDAAVVLHLRIRLKPGCMQDFLAYVSDAFPVFEAGCDCKGAVYADARDPEALDEVFYYRTEQDFREGERLTEHDTRQVELLKRWRTLLAGPPQVDVQRRIL